MSDLICGLCWWICEVYVWWMYVVVGDVFVNIWVICFVVWVFEIVFKIFCYCSNCRDWVEVDVMYSIYNFVLIIFNLVLG